MKPVFQTKRGLGGNCLAACLASIFELPLEEMPDLAPPECFTDCAVQMRLNREWLACRGFDYLEIDLEKQAYHFTQGAIPCGPCLFAVLSPTPEIRAKGWGHFVVGELREEDGKVQFLIIHDPLNPISEETSKFKVTAVGFFVPLNPQGSQLLK